MNRRILIKQSARLALGAISIPLVQNANAQDVYQTVVDSSLRNQDWVAEVESFLETYRLASIVLNLRFLYSVRFEDATGISAFGPFDNSREAREDYVKVLRDSFFGQNQGVSIETMSRIRSFIEGNANKLNDELQQLFQGSGSEFLDWLESIGIDPTELLATDLLLAQARFALANLSTTGASSFQDDNARQGCWWPYPFCFI